MSDKCAKCKKPIIKGDEHFFYHLDDDSVFNNL